MKFGDRVKVINGFFKDQTGILIDYSPAPAQGAIKYLVLFNHMVGADYIPQRWVFDNNLEKVE
jgi:hypothetical protein